jgi:hypothetical protein
LVKWIEEALGEEAASLWAWNCTPAPCGLPTDSQLADGLAVAAGELDLNALLAETEREMAREYEEYERES